MQASERRITGDFRNRVLTNIGVWSPDSRWLVYDTRSDPAGESFDGQTIEMVDVGTGEIRVLYTSRNGAHCGVATFHPARAEIVFILGPEHPSAEWSYGPFHRQGVLVDCARPGIARNLDARDVVPPFTTGALRGGSHVHVWDPRGEWVSFTYEDHVLAQLPLVRLPGTDINQRNIGVSVPSGAVTVPPTHLRNHDGDYFSVLVTRTVADPRPGSDEISRACEEGWVGVNGYLRQDGSRQRRALAFQGRVHLEDGALAHEVFLVDLPEDVTTAGEGPLCGTTEKAPSPPKGARQRRLTYTGDRKYPGLQGPRHWLRSSPDGSRIAFLMKDDAGVVQLWTVSPSGGAPAQVTGNPWPVDSAFSWSPDGQWIAHVMDGSVCVSSVQNGRTLRLTGPAPPGAAPRPEACAFSPDGRKIAFSRCVTAGGRPTNQLYTLEIPQALGWQA